MRKEERRIGKPCDLRTSFRRGIHRILHRRRGEPCRIAVRSFGLSGPSLFPKTDCTGQAKASAFPAAAVQYNTLHLHAGGVPLQGAFRLPFRSADPCAGRRQRGIANVNPPILPAAGVARKVAHAAVFLAAFFLPCFCGAVTVIPAENADQSTSPCRASRRAAQVPALRSRRSSD